MVGRTSPFLSADSNDHFFLPSSTIIVIIIVIVLINQREPLECHEFVCKAGSLSAEGRILA